jgi:hypothetical protein
MSRSSIQPAPRNRAVALLNNPLKRKHSAGRVLWLGVAALLLLATAAFAIFTNGGFETGDFTSWTKETHLNTSIPTFPPVQLSDLGLTAGGTDLTTVETGLTPESVPDDES